MIDFDMKVLAANLRGERAKARKMQAEVADAIGVNVNSVQNWENGDSIPSVCSVYLLADLYGTTIDALCGRGA